MSASSASPTGHSSLQDATAPSDNKTFIPAIAVHDAAEASPSTPPRGRVGARYPASLSRGDSGRVPLHRRGTSRTYERLEDLLKEAGYKETRVFTPEAERAEAREREREKAARRTGSVRSGVDAVVGFLAGWMPGASKHEDQQSGDDEHSASESEVAQHRSVPPSPLAGKHTRKGVVYSSFSPTSSVTTLDSSLHSSMHSSKTSSKTTSPTTSHHQLPPRDPYILQRPPIRLLRPQSSNSTTLRTYAQVSAAQGYLRHMASTPNMPKRRGSNLVIPNDRQSLTLNDGNEPPPLPSKWIDSVTRAVLRAPSTAYPGGPSSYASSRQSTRTVRTRESKFTLSDHRRQGTEEGPNTYGLAPPQFSTLMQRGRTVPGTVNTVRVVCRSAPASRSSSRVGNRGKDSDRRRDERKGRFGKGKSDNCVPTLTNTRLENDAWGLQWVDGKRTSGADEWTDDNDDLDDEDDGELDLARILVPPKRQHSISSLRRHLHRSESARALRMRGSPRLEPWTIEDEENGGTRPRGVRQRSRQGSTEEGEHGYGWEAAGMPGFDKVGAKRRRGIPTFGGGRS